MPAVPPSLAAALAGPLPHLELRLQPVTSTGLCLWLLDPAAADAPVAGDDARRLAAAPPYWSLCWAAGTALAERFTREPGLVAGRSVIDFGAGSGVVAIAAARAGAREVYAVDSDPVAREACRANAAANGVSLRCAAGLDEAPPLADVVTVADVFYDPANLPLLPALRARAKTLFVADARRADLEGRGLRPLGAVEAKTVPDFNDPQFERVRLFST